MRSKRSRAWHRRKKAALAAARLAGGARVVGLGAVTGTVKIRIQQPDGTWTTFSEVDVEDFIDSAENAEERRERKAEVFGVLYGAAMQAVPFKRET